MIDKMNEHYSMTNPASVYDEEALTALELAGRTAGKMNEVVGLVNENEANVAEAKVYMVHNLPKFTEEAVKELQENGELETMLVKTVSEGKVDKNGLEQINMRMLSQDVKEAMTGGSVAVVGVDAVSTSNIVNGAVTSAKLDPMLFPQNGFTNGDLKIPFLITDHNAKTAVFNEDFKAQASGIYFNLFSPLGLKGVNMDTLQIDASEWTGVNNFSVYYDPDLNLMKIVNGTVIKTGLYRLGYWFGDKLYHMPFSFVHDGRYYKYGNLTYDESLPLSKNVTSFFPHQPLIPDTAMFTVNFTAGTVEINRNAGSLNCFHASRAFAINFATVTATVEKPATHYAVMYDLTKNHLYFDNFVANTHDDCFFLGLVCAEPEKGNCILPYATANGLFYYPGRTGRIYADLLFSYTENEGTYKIPYMDFEEHCLVIPGGINLYAVWGDGFTRPISTYDTETKILFDGNERFIYLVGGVDGLHFEYGGAYGNPDNSFRADELFYFGCVDTESKQIELHCKCGDGKSVSILGDSISTYAGTIPDGNANYYDGSKAGVTRVSQMWWKRALDALGYKLNTNQSYSGDRVTNRGVTRATQLDNGTHPDIILIQLGINDFNNGVALGSYNGRGAVPSETTTFREAYANMLKAMLKKYKRSKVYACTLVTDQRTTDEVDSPEANSAGVYLSEYNDAIREIAKAFCVEVIDMESCGITNYNGAQYMGDYNEETTAFLHPNADGHRLISETVIKALR